jgi:hypothetical protein
VSDGVDREGDIKRDILRVKKSAIIANALEISQFSRREIGHLVGHKRRLPDLPVLKRAKR